MRLWTYIVGMLKKKSKKTMRNISEGDVRFISYKVDYFVLQLETCEFFFWFQPSTMFFSTSAYFVVFARALHEVQG